MGLTSLLDHTVADHAAPPMDIRGRLAHANPPPDHGHRNPAARPVQ